MRRGKSVAARRSNLFCLGVGLLVASAAAPARAERLTIATTEFTGNWNPVSFESYPAQLVVRFTTERLFEKRCVGGEDQTEPVLANLCQAGTGYDQSGSIRLAIDRQRCDGLAPADVAFTVKQIGKQPYNDYHTHELALNGDRLSLNKPRAPAEWVAKEAFSFPLLRRPVSEALAFYEETITVGGQGRYNEATGGVFKIASIDERSVKLVPRRPAEAPITEVEFVFYDRFLNMQSTMSGENQPDLVLSWPITKPHADRDYTPRKPENLGSFTYVGFNFRTADELQKELIGSQRFRELFTKSLWVLSPVEDQVDFGGRGGGGVFLGESFDTGSPDATNRPTRQNIATAIADFVSDQNLRGLHEMVVLVSPAFEKLFDRADRANIATELDELWRTEGGAGLHFELRDPAAGPAAFEREKRKGETYHMIFDTFIYGRNHLRYMAFVQPGNSFNVLGIEIASLSSDRIEVWMEEGARGIKAFLDVVAREYPVAVIGHFPRRDLFHRSVVIPHDCPPKAVPLPYQGFDRWRKVPVEQESAP